MYLFGFGAPASQRYVLPHEPSLPLLMALSFLLCCLFDNCQKVLPPKMLLALPASATMPAVIGDATLVPQASTQPL